MDNEFAKSTFKERVKGRVTGFGYLFAILAVWALICGVVWLASAGTGFLTFGDNKQAILEYADTIAIISFVASVPFVALALLYIYNGLNPERFFSALWTGLKAGPVFLTLVLIISWVAPDKIPTPTELGITVCILVVAAAVIKSINYRE